MESAERMRFINLSARANVAPGHTFEVSKEDHDFLYDRIIENLKGLGLTPVPRCDSEGRILFRGKGLVTCLR